jgi:hypothetical protein
VSPADVSGRGSKCKGPVASARSGSGDSGGASVPAGVDVAPEVSVRHREHERKRPPPLDAEALEVSDGRCSLLEARH